jgi:hypothetical protein
MKVAIGKVPLDLSKGNELSMRIRSPAKPRGLAFVLSQRLITRGGEPEFDEQLVMFIETTSDGPLMNRQFVVVPTGKHIESKPGVHVEYIGTAISMHSGIEAHLFEVHES